MKLAELEPQFLKIKDERTYLHVDNIKEADGIDFLCPVCFVANGNSNKGTHHIMCWQLHVPQTHYPIPGRWNFLGTCFTDLTLQNGSSSVLLTGGCRAHFFIKNGEIKLC